MTKAYAKLNDNETIRYRLFWWLLFLMLLNSVLYLFFINFGVSEILIKKEISSLLREEKSENQILEGGYLAAFKKLNIDDAEKLGYVKTETKIFVNRTIFMAKNDQIKTN